MSIVDTLSAERRLKVLTDELERLCAHAERISGWQRNNVPISAIRRAVDEATS